MTAIEPTRAQPATNKPWQPTYTPKEAVGGLISKDGYQRLTIWARTIVEYHDTLGTPRTLWEPTPTHSEQLVGPFIDAGDAKLETRLSSDVDPLLDRAAAANMEAKRLIEAAESHPYPATTPESGVTYSGADASATVDGHSQRIEDDFAAGKGHHKRAHPALKLVGKWAPWAEAIGFLAFVTYYLNVPLLRPWEDLLGWTFAAVVVTGIILGQTWLVRHAADSHNRAREASADSNRHMAEATFAQRNRYLGGGSATALAITSGMVLRGVTALGHAAPQTTIVMVLLATVTGVVLPTLAYLATALDGSKRSRERDSLTADLTADLEQQETLEAGARMNLAIIRETTAILRDKVVPDIHRDVQATIDAVHPIYNFGRIQIGGLAADPPVKVPITVIQGGDGDIERAFLSTGIPGARSVDLKPALNRSHRLRELALDADGLAKRLDAIPVHPWNKSNGTQISLTPPG